MTENTNETLKMIGQRLRTRRKELGLSQAEIAEKLKISTTFYGNVERGVQDISVEKLIELHRITNIDLTFLLTGKICNAYSVQQILENIPKEDHFDIEQILRHIQNICNKKKVE